MRYKVDFRTEYKPFLVRIGAWPKTKKLALEASILKWDIVVAWIEATDTVPNDGGTDTCPLCHLFFDDGCTGCPISCNTGRQNCDGTPYQKFESVGYPAVALKYAKQEARFLESLLGA